MLASNGLATPPCGVPRMFPLPPLMRRVPSASRSSIGALSHILMRRRTFRSTTRRATDFISSECGIVSKEAATTTHHRDIPDSLTITRERHVFEGQSLAVISSIRRRGVLLVLVVLPDGSRSLIPASWTDWSPEQTDRTPADDVGGGDHDLGRLGDLLHLRKVLDALSGRHVESAPRKESGHAIETGLPRPNRSC